MRLKHLGFGLILLASGSYSMILNNPYPESDRYKNIYYTSFSEQPKTLDPAKSYTSTESEFTSQIYESLLQYDYFLRPYRLIPLTAASMPKVTTLNRDYQPATGDDIAYSVYTIRIKPGILFQPHPAFAKNKQGEYAYLSLPKGYLRDHRINQLSDFKETGTREVVANDYLYQIKRLASPKVNSPIYGLMSDYIAGFRDFYKALPDSNQWIDLNQYPMSGLRQLDPYTLEIVLKGQYPQFIFWLAMPFFVPIPWEADCFYSQPGMDEKNLNLNWYPVGTGPFMLTKNDPNSHMILTKNPSFRLEYFPTNGSKEDEKAGYMIHAGQRIPLISQAVFTLEKESIPRWNKFLQGYYDLSGVAADSFDQAIRMNALGQLQLTQDMQSRDLRLSNTIDPAIFYLGFNLLDPIVGGHSDRARKLRLAISIAIHTEEEIAIFYNGRGRVAQGPIPPAVFGYKEGKAGINPYVYDWNGKAPQRKPLVVAKRLMQEAGYPKGIDQQTGQPLILNYDLPITGGPDDKAQLDWIRKQFAKIGIDLNVQATQYNRFQEKMRTGNAQIFKWGWVADYPDPDNFLFLLYGPNGKVEHGGENAANYHNASYDQLFNRMRISKNGPERQRLIDQMVEIVRHDAPWVWGMNTETLQLSQRWVYPRKPNTININTLKYLAIDVESRNKWRQLWNKPVLWPIGLIGLLVGFSLLPLLRAYYKKEKQQAPRVKP